MGACCNKPFVKSEVTPRCNSILSRKAIDFVSPSQNQWHFSQGSPYFISGAKGAKYPFIQLGLTIHSCT